MLYMEIIAVCSQINTKHINTVWVERGIVPSFKALGTYSYHSVSNFQQYLLYNEDNFPLNLTTVQHLTLISLFLLKLQIISGPISNLAPCTCYPPEGPRTDITSVM
jgi:hypothetical protein